MKKKTTEYMRPLDVKWLWRSVKSKSISILIYRYYQDLLIVKTDFLNRSLQTIDIITTLEKVRDKNNPTSNVYTHEKDDYTLIQRNYQRNLR